MYYLSIIFYFLKFIIFSIKFKNLCYLKFFIILFILSSLKLFVLKGKIAIKFIQILYILILNYFF